MEISAQVHKEDQDLEEDDSIMDTTPAALSPAKSGAYVRVCECKNNVLRFHEVLKKSVGTLENEPFIIEDEIACFTNMLSAKIRSLPTKQRSLAQLRLMQAMVEVELQ